MSKAEDVHSAWPAIVARRRTNQTDSHEEIVGAALRHRQATCEIERNSNEENCDRAEPPFEDAGEKSLSIENISTRAQTDRGNQRACNRAANESSRHSQ